MRLRRKTATKEVQECRRHPGQRNLESLAEEEKEKMKKKKRKQKVQAVTVT